MSAIVTVANIVAARNKTSFGSHLTFLTQHSFWLTPTSQTLAQLASVRIVRLLDYAMNAGNVNPCISWDESLHSGTYDWNTFDATMDMCKQLGVPVLLVLGFIDGGGWKPIANMPVTSTGLPSPEDYAGYVRDVVTHVKNQGFTVPYYELINESWFYYGQMVDLTKLGYFFALYDAAYDIVKSLVPAALVGNDSSLFNSFLTNWKAMGGRLDFFSGHKYDGYGIPYPDSQGLDAADKKFFTYYDSNHLTVSQARTLWGNVNMPALFTESNFNAAYEGGTDPRIQGPVGQAWCGIVALNSIHYGVDYLIYYDWCSAPTPTGSLGFGLINRSNSQPYETYNIMRNIFSKLSVNDEVLNTTVTGNTAIKAQGWKHNGVIYCIIVNRGSTPISVSFENQTISFPTYGTKLVTGSGTILKSYVFSQWQDGDKSNPRTITV